MSDARTDVTVRPMTAEDVPAAEIVWSESFGAMRIAHGVGSEPRTDETIAHSQARLRHLLETDPLGSWVAESAGSLVGFAHAIVRERLWVLSLLAVSPAVQQRHIGKRLLDAALQSYPADGTGMIFSSPDPRAMRRYTMAGFELHPSMIATGTVDARALRPPRAVRPGTAHDLPFVDDIDRAVRGSAHGPDVTHALHEGCVLFIAEDAGYAVARGGNPVLVAAHSTEAASDLLSACLQCARDDEVVEIRWLTSGQQWAIRVALQAGLVLRPMGPVMTKDMPGPPPHYLPSGAYG